jgi:hypothetical protein
MRSWLLIAALAGCSGIGFAQGAPVKMGLWEKKMTMDVGTGAPRQLVSRSCVTPEIWQEMAGNVSKPRDGCTMNNAKNAHGYTFNATCKTPDGGTMVTSGSTTIEDSQHIVSETHAIMTTNGQKREMKSVSTSTFLSADCGKIKPGEPESDYH